MREIKFRAWNKEQKIMCYQNEDESAEYQDGAYGSDVQILNSLLKGYLERYEWMQFTELHDKNGKEIYEADILKLVDYHGSRIVEVDFHGGVYYYTGDGFSDEYIFNANDIEILGNIYENKNLLEEQP